MKKAIQEYFKFSKQELNGFLGLLLITFILFFIPEIYRAFFLNNMPNQADQKALQKLIFSAESAEKYPAFRREGNLSNDRSKINLFPFDPNSVDINGWMQLGLSRKQAESILNYRSKGGKFYKPEDLGRMYTVSPQLMKKWMPFIQIRQKVATDQFVFNTAKLGKITPAVMVNVNQADSLELQTIRGIGPAFARRIIQYRNRIGGFHSSEQLKEVYGIDSSKYNEIKNQIFVDAKQIQKIDINKATFEDLKNNPYLKYKQINALIQYRKQHGSFSDILSLKKVTLLPEQVIHNLTPYLIFND